MEAQVHYQETDHDMSNYALRDPPDFSQANILPPFRGTDKRLVLVDGLSIGGKLAGSRPWGDGTLRLGVDFRQSENGATVFDPDAPPFFVENFDDATTDEYGAFIEWSGDLTGPWSGEFGVRVHHTRTDADTVQHFRPTCQMLLRVNANLMNPYGPDGAKTQAIEDAGGVRCCRSERLDAASGDVGRHVERALQSGRPQPNGHGNRRHGCIPLRMGRIDGT